MTAWAAQASRLKTSAASARAEINCFVGLDRPSARNGVFGAVYTFQNRLCGRHQIRSSSEAVRVQGKGPEAVCGLHLRDWRIRRCHTCGGGLSLNTYASTLARANWDGRFLLDYVRQFMRQQLSAIGCMRLILS